MWFNSCDFAFLVLDGNIMEKSCVILFHACWDALRKYAGIRCTHEFLDSRCTLSYDKPAIPVHLDVCVLEYGIIVLTAMYHHLILHECRSSFPSLVLQGKIVYSNGDFFEGHFSNGQIDGEGRLTCRNGLEYIGEWRHSQVLMIIMYAYMCLYMYAHFIL